jgi:hypothetical protein
VESVMGVGVETEVAGMGVVETEVGAPQGLEELGTENERVA